MFAIRCSMYVKCVCSFKLYLHLMISHHLESANIYGVLATIMHLLSLFWTIQMLLCLLDETLTGAHLWRNGANFTKSRLEDAGNILGDIRTKFWIKWREKEEEMKKKNCARSHALVMCGWACLIFINDVEFSSFKPGVKSKHPRVK